MILELISYQVKDKDFTLWLEKTITENQIEIVGTPDIPFVYTDGKIAEIAGVLGMMEHFNIPENCKQRENLPEFINDAEHFKKVLEYHHIPVDDTAEEIITGIFAENFVTVRYLQEEDS